MKCGANASRVIRGISPSANRRTLIMAGMQSNPLNLNCNSFSSIAKDDIFVSINTNGKSQLQK